MSRRHGGGSHHGSGADDHRSTHSGGGSSNPSDSGTRDGSEPEEEGGQPQGGGRTDRRSPSEEGGPAQQRAADTGRAQGGTGARPGRGHGTFGNPADFYATAARVEEAGQRIEAANARIAGRPAQLRDILGNDPLTESSGRLLGEAGEGHHRAARATRTGVGRVSQGLSAQGRRMQQTDEGAAMGLSSLDRRSTQVPSPRDGQGTGTGATGSDGGTDTGGSQQPALPQGGPGASGDSAGTADGSQAGSPAGDNLSRKKKSRPSIRTSSKRQIFRDSPRAENGEDFRCPNSGRTIPCKRDSDGNAIRINEKGKQDPDGFTIPQDNPRSGSGQPQVYHFGHKPESEYWRLEQLMKDHGDSLSRKDFLDEYNRPEHYWVENPGANVGHGHESTEPGYGHYGSMLDRLAERQNESGGSPAHDSLSSTTGRPLLRRR